MTTPQARLLQILAVEVRSKTLKVFESARDEN
jgi:hypothetical protein